MEIPKSLITVERINFDENKMPLTFNYNETQLSNRDVLFEYHRAVVPFVEQLDQLEVCLPYSRLLSGIPILMVLKKLRWNSNKTTLINMKLNIEMNGQL